MTDENLLYFLMENIYIYVKYLHEWKIFTFKLLGILYSRFNFTLKRVVKKCMYLTINPSSSAYEVLILL